MHWVLQNNIFNERAFDTLVDTLVRYQISHSIHKIIPFVGELDPTPTLHTDNVMCVGSYSMRHIADAYAWEPGVFDLEPYHFLIQLEHWGDHMLNADSVVGPFETVSFDGDEMFVRPIHDSKIFPGGLFTKGGFDRWKRSVLTLKEDHGTSISGDTLIQVCAPKNIYAEYRFWIVKGKIITKSSYRIGGRVIYTDVVDERFDDYVRQRVAEWQPHDAFVIDVCDTPRGIKIVEINTINSCGFYAANIPKLVEAIEQEFHDNSTPPHRSSREYQQIVSEGCTADRDRWGEISCDKDWSCDECPVVTHQHEDTTNG